jgi:hypothetical protein
MKVLNQLARYLEIWLHHLKLPGRGHFISAHFSIEGAHFANFDNFTNFEATQWAVEEFKCRGLKR